MLAISINQSIIKESGVVYIFFRFLVLCSINNKKINVKIFQGKKLSQAGQKNKTKDWYKIFLLK